MDINMPPIGGSDRIGDVPAKPSPADERDKDFSKVLSDAGDRVDAVSGTPPPELRGGSPGAGARSRGAAPAKAPPAGRQSAGRGSAGCQRARCGRAR